MKPTHLLAAALFTALILACLAAPAAAFSGAGSGTQSDPYIITTPAQLQEMNNDLAAYYQLGNDIDLSGLNTWDCIGSESAPFSGVLDGNGYKISDLSFSKSIAYQSTSDYQLGLFIWGGNIVNINFDSFDVEIVPTYQNGGGWFVCGLFYNSNIDNCMFTNINLYCNLNAKNSDYNVIFLSLFSRGTLNDCLINSPTINVEIINTVLPSYYSNRVSYPQIASFMADISNIYVQDIKLISSGNYRTNGNGPFAPIMYSDIIAPISDNMINNILVNGDITTSGDYFTSAHRVWAVAESNTNSKNTFSNYAYNIRWNTNVLNSGSLTNRDGASVDENTIKTQSFYQQTLGWDFTNTWYWDDTDKLPKLQVFRTFTPTISSISATPATGGQLTEYTLSAIATTEAEGGIASYQWSYSTDSGQTWQPISGATAATYVWQPGTSISGTVLLKCYITGADGGTVDSYEAGYTNIQITVVPPPEIDSVSASRPLQKVNTPTTLTATFGDIQTGNTYQWYYSTNGGTTWQAISGATQPTAQYTPTTTGFHNIKIIVTTQYGDTTETTTSITVLPTYTPTPITNTSVDISIDSTAKYQGMQQFILSSELKALNYYTPTIAHLAHDNALYYLDSAEREVTPVSTTTGGTISAAYVGQYTGVITDTAGNTAFYSYQSNDWQYVEQNNAQIIASTSSYAATVSGGTLRVYNLNGNLVASTATTAANLAGNDATNVFVSYSGSTITYYWVNGNSISSASQTLTHSITELHQITGTGNFIISTAANTYIVEITDAGVYSIITTSDTDTPLLNTQSTSINVFIGTSGNEIYIIGADGETDGTYVSGSTLMDASISKATGLYALAGGADYQVYILAKSQSSTWQLQQVVAFGSAINYSQISTTGTYAAISTGLKLYLLEAVDVSTGTYMLQGAVIGSSGSPYAGKLITINGDQIRTDTSGRFLYPVSPGTLYTIIADTTEVEYTATNAALQQIAIKMKPNPYAQSVSYSAEYNEDTSSFEMQYNDQTGKTESVTWVIRESGNSTTVWTGTSTPGQTISWEVPFDKVFTGYQISMIADRSGSNVENVWMITPAGSQPIDIGGLDDTGKNIIFGCVLMVLAGLFGVMYSTKGALFIVLAAGVMVFLGLLTIPWEVIIVAGLLAVLALLAKGGGGS